MSSLSMQLLQMVFLQAQAPAETNIQGSRTPAYYDWSRTKEGREEEGTQCPRKHYIKAITEKKNRQSWGVSCTGWCMLVHLSKDELSYSSFLSGCTEWSFPSVSDFLITEIPTYSKCLGAFGIVFYSSCCNRSSKIR